MAKYIGERAGEVFLGNVAGGVIPAHMAEFTTLRIGDKALDINGKPLVTHKPMFINKSEELKYGRLMIARMKSKS